MCGGSQGTGGAHTEYPCAGQPLAWELSARAPDRFGTGRLNAVPRAQWAEGPCFSPGFASDPEESAARIGPQDWSPRAGSWEALPPKGQAPVEFGVWTCLPRTRLSVSAPWCGRSRAILRCAGAVPGPLCSVPSSPGSWRPSMPPAQPCDPVLSRRQDAGQVGVLTSSSNSGFFPLLGL